MKRTLISIITLISALCISAQERLTLQQAQYGSSLFGMRGTPHLSWMNDGEHYSSIQRDNSGNVQVVAISAKDGSSKVLIPADQLVDKTSGKQLNVEDFTISPDQDNVLIYTNSRKVWRLNTRGDYWVLNRKSGTLHQLGKGLPESSLMFAKFSPDNNKVAYVSRNNIYVEDLQSKTYKPVTNDGCDTIVNGTFDWVYEEEFSCRDGFRWSADSKYIAYWQSNTSGTGWFDIINNVDSIYPTVTRFPYPKAGTTNSGVRIGYVPADGGSTSWLPIPGDPRDNYLPRMEFVPGTDVLFIQQMNRQQNTNKVWTFDISKANASNASSLLRNIFTDTDKAWLETNDNVHFLPGGKYFTFTSERDGWRHIYRVSMDGKKVSLITKGNFDVVEEVGYDEAKQQIYFIASPDNATQRYLYRADINAGGKCQLISDPKEKGQHSYNMSPTCDYAIHTFSNATTMPRADLVDMRSMAVVRNLTDNSEAQARYNNLGLSQREFVKVKSGDLTLDAWILKPADFDPTKRYPVIDYVYGEPWGSTVQDSWEYSLFWQYLANQGYIVVSIENRGAAAPRGREWRKCIYGEVGTAASEDQARGIMDMARQFSFIDSTRIGITGWSGGGSQTLNCMFRYPDVFHTGIAIAFVADQRLYDTIYQERYMNTPQANAEGYRLGSPITYVDGLKGNLLLIHGTGDDNVHYQSCEMLVDQLISHGKIFYQLSYPMRTHAISERQGTYLHLRKSITDFWLKNLPAGGR